MTERAELRARANSAGGWGWSASQDDPNRYVMLMGPRFRNRRRCPNCPCGGKASHLGMANGLALTYGCEWSMRQWVRNPRWAAQWRLQQIAKRRARIDIQETT